jgi:hypothetical protein
VTPGAPPSAAAAAARLEPFPCPLCGARSAIAPSAVLRWACETCGGPRVPGSSAKDPDLERAWREGRRARTLRLVAWPAFAVAAVLALAALLTMAMAGAAWGIAGLVMASVPATLGLALRGGAHKSATAVEPALQAAWGRAVMARLRAHEGAVTHGELAAELGLPSAEAEAVLARLAAHDRVRVDVGDDAHLRYAIGAGGSDELGDEPGDEPARRAPRARMREGRHS